ncbi:MAG: hypothetical protein F4Y94_05665 [Chloroflexi bacterium]|nr:hypothetical protein [Chloroflexota bacterium]
MRRLTVLLLALSALLAACGGEDRSAEVEQLQADAAALRAEVASLSGELEIAQTERDRGREELSQARAALDRLTEAAEAATAAAQAASDDPTPDSADGTAAPASDEVRAYFEEVERISQTFAAAGEEIVAKMDALALRGDLDATKALFDDLAELQAKAVGEAVALAPPPALAALHEEAAAAEQSFAEAMADYARAVGNVTTWEAFAAVVEAFPQTPDFLAAADRSVATCYALQDAAAASGITIDLRCDGL